MSRKRHIMHGLSEVAGQGSYSVSGLQNMGLDAQMVVWEPNTFGYPYDKCLHINKTKKYLLPYYALRMLVFYVYAMFRYNTFHFHFGRSMLLNYDLWFLKLLCKRVVYEFHGSDLRDAAVANEILGRPNFPVGENDGKQKKKNAELLKKIDTVILHDDELIPHLPPDHPAVYVLPLRLDIEQFVPVYPAVEVPRVRIVHAPSKRAGKGTKYVLKAVEQLQEKYPIDFILVENLSRAEARKIYETADIIVDQLLTGTYGVFAIEGMALGKPVITYIMDSMKKKLPEELPIVSASPDDIYERLEELVQDGALRNRLGRAGRKYAETYHDYRNIAEVLAKIYDRALPPATGQEAFARVREVYEKKQK
jgi:glycosyltransferase involved in cell wall biosynthesis